MQLAVTFRHMEPSDALKDYARDKISRVEKYLDSALEVSVVLSVEKFRHTADVTILSDGLKINAQEQTEDMYSAIDMVVDKIERQIKRSRQKIKSRKGGKRGKTKDMAMEAGDMEADAETDARPQVVRSQQMYAKPMDVDEAVMQLDLHSDKFLVFTNSETEKINVIYRRDDGHYELIEPMSE
jgi:putative sigma-54 modulation protein